jgi:hypothetical protein
VRKATNTNKEELEEKIIQKLQNALQYREEQLEKIKEKMREHVLFILKSFLFIVNLN